MNLFSPIHVFLHAAGAGVADDRTCVQRPWAAKQPLEFPAGHGQACAVVEIAHVKPEGAVFTGGRAILFSPLPILAMPGTQPATERGAISRSIDAP